MCWDYYATLTMFDSYGDGGGSLTINDDYFELLSGSEESFDFCVVNCLFQNLMKQQILGHLKIVGNIFGGVVIASGGGLGLGSYQDH